MDGSGRTVYCISSLQFWSACIGCVRWWANSGRPPPREAVGRVEGDCCGPCCGTLGDVRPVCPILVALLVYFPTLKDTHLWTEITFASHSPYKIIPNRTGAVRPSLVSLPAGMTFTPDTSPLLKYRKIRLAGPSHLFVRSQVAARHDDCS
jgi:hypothetical protein